MWAMRMYLGHTFKHVLPHREREPLLPERLQKAVSRLLLRVECEIDLAALLAVKLLLPFLDAAILGAPSLGRRLVEASRHPLESLQQSLVGGVQQLF